MSTQNSAPTIRWYRFSILTWQSRSQLWRWNWWIFLTWIRVKVTILPLTRPPHQRRPENELTCVCVCVWTVGGNVTTGMWAIPIFVVCRTSFLRGFAEVVPLGIHWQHWWLPRRLVPIPSARCLWLRLAGAFFCVPYSTQPTRPRSPPDNSAVKNTRVSL